MILLIFQKGVLAASVWSKHIFTVFNMTSRVGEVANMTCKAHCYFSAAPCTMYVVDEANKNCYMGNRDTHNELSISLTDSFELFESKGTQIGGRICFTFLPLRQISDRNANLRGLQALHERRRAGLRQQSPLLLQPHAAPAQLDLQHGRPSAGRDDHYLRWKGRDVSYGI